MKPRSEPATKEEKLRYAALKSLGCIVSRKQGLYGVPAEIHHLTSGGRRLGNEFTIPLNPWFHRAVIPPGYGLKNTTEAIAMFGPSLETSKRDFVARFGTEMELLAETNRLLGTNVTHDS